MDEIVHKFQQDNADLTLQRNEVHYPLRQVFREDVEVARIREDGKRKRVFLNITTRTMPLQSINWLGASEENIPHLCHGWLLRAKSHGLGDEIVSLTFSKLSGVMINNNELVLDLIINPTNLEFSLSGLLGRRISNLDLGCAIESVNPPINVPFVLAFLNGLSFCRGFQKERISRSLRSPQNEQCVEVNLDGNDVIISKECKVFLDGGKRSSSCFECRRLSKSLMRRRKEECANIMRTKNNLLSDSDKLLKMQELQKAQRLMLTAKLENCKRRFEEECLTIDEDDNADFLAMMPLVDSSKVNEDMKLLLKEQERAVLTPSKNGYRWHPK